MVELLDGSPIRLQLRRAKGFNLQAISVALNGRPARNCARKGRYGNPFFANVDGSPMDARQATRLFTYQLQRYGCFRPVSGTGLVTIEEIKRELRGKNLACFCKTTSPHCHVDVLLEIANGD